MSRKSLKITNKYVVTNKFNVKPNYYTSFETLWKTRKSYLKDMPGFISFDLLKNNFTNGEYISLTIWEDQKDFKAWLESPQFVESHGINDLEKLNKMRDMVYNMPITEYYDVIA